MRYRLVFVVSAFALTLHAHAQHEAVMAKDEPSHRNKFDNGIVRVLDVEVAPGAATLFHTHALDYPYVMLSQSLLRNEVPGQAPKDITINAGLVGFYRASEGEYTHRFVNAGDGTFRAIGIELLRGRLSPAVNMPLTDGPTLTTVLDNERVRGYRVKLAPGESLGPISISGPSMRVVISGGSLQQRTQDSDNEEVKLAPARFTWREQSVNVTLRNVGSDAIELIEFEFK